MKPSFKKKLENTLKIVTVILCIAVTIISFISIDNHAFNIQQKSRKQSDNFVRVIDVGQGDSILIHSGGYSALIDTGPAEKAKDLSSSLNALGIDTIDVLMLSHLHVDHTGGISEIVNNFQVENIILPRLSTFSEGIYSAELAINTLTSKGKGVFSAREGMNFKIGDFDITVVAMYNDILNENNCSVIIKAECDSKRFLFMGDAESGTERKLIKDKKDIDCDVLKVGHHGSNTSTTADLLRNASPKMAVISVGTNNMYHHPHAATITQLKHNRINVYRTDKQGDITFHIENNKIRVKTEK